MEIALSTFMNYPHLAWGNWGLGVSNWSLFLTSTFLLTFPVWVGYFLHRNHAKLPIDEYESLTSTL